MQRKIKMINLPIDANMKVIPVTPAVIPLATTYDATVSSSTAITLNASTTYIEVTAIDKGVFMKWGATAAANAFDEFIGANQTKGFVIPTGQTSVQFIEESATAKLVVIEK